jgi:phage/plasmid-associated DNA primase
MISHPGLIAVRNGVLRFADLTLLPADTTLLMRTGRLGHHDPIPYDPTAKSDELMEFLNRLFPDPDVLDYVLCAVASSIDGIRRTPNLFLCHGTGSNGKSAFQSLVEMTLGDYATTLQAEILCRKSQLESIKRQVAGKRWIGVGEPVPGASLHVGTLTNLLESNVAHAFLFTCELPSLKAEEAFWAKVRVLPFLTTFGTGQVAPDLHLQQKLPTWRTAFLSLLIGRMAAATAYPRVEPERVTQATLQYRRANDPFLQFVSEYLIPTDDPTLILTPPELRSLWREFRKAKALGPPGLSGGDLKESDVLERLRGVAYGSLIRTAE